MARARITLKLGGENRLIKFTISTMKRYDNNAEKEGAALEHLMRSPMTALLDLTKLALTYEGNDNKLPENLSDDLVADWIDDLNEKDMKRLVEAMMLSVKKFGAVYSEDEKKIAKETL